MEKDGNAKNLVLIAGVTGEEPCAYIPTAIKEAGVIPVLSDQRDWRGVLSTLSECDGVFMMKGWKKDRMARLIHFIALKTGMVVMVEK